MRLGMSVIAVVACGFPDVPDEMVVRGRHVEVHHDPTLPVCAEAVDDADRFIEATAALLGEPARKTPYYLYRDTVEQCRLYGEESADCESDGKVYSSRWILFHEIVHAVSDDLGAPPPLLLEGLAEALGRGYPLLYPEQRAVAHVELDTVAFFSHDPFDNYEVAGDFVGYLLDRYGVARFRELYGKLLYLSDPLTTWTQFRRVYGESLDDVIAAWRTATPGSPQFPLRQMRCGAPTIEPSADTWAETMAFDCPSWNSTSVQYVLRSIDVASAGIYTGDFELIEPSGRVALDASLDTCDSAEAEVCYTRFANAGAHLLLTAFAPGRHSLAFNSSFGEQQPSTLTWNVTRLPGESTSCATPAVFVPPEERWSLSLRGDPSDWPGRVAGRPDVAALWIRIEDNPSATINATLYVGHVAQLCNGDCAAPTNCVDLKNTATLWTPTPGEPIYFHVVTPTSEEVQVVIAGRP